MDVFLNGDELYGDNLSIDQIQVWYEEEKEAYADLYGTEEKDALHGFDIINELYGYKYIRKIPSFKKTLGLGSSWGYEFLPIIEKIEELYIIEPSSQTISKELGNVKPIYSKPESSGVISFPDNTFDLICAFSVLHHIPNVSFVLTELLRVLAPGGYLLLREPIISMGNWREKRPGLTKHERGIPEKIFADIFNKENIQVIEKHYHFTMTSFFRRIFKNSAFFNSKVYYILDKYLSKILAFNIHYHARNKLERCAPQSIFYVLRKPQEK